MAKERLNRHDSIHHELFDEDTAQVGSLGDLVEKHAGDAVFLTAPEKSPNGVDNGESDFVAEMLMTDPASHEEISPDDLYSAEDEVERYSTDQTGTVEGISRGFGTHLPQDIGAKGFQVETIPDRVLNSPRYTLADGEELDDYDDDKVDDISSPDSQPFGHMVSDSGDHQPTPGRIALKNRRPASSDDELDGTRRMK